MDIEYAEFARRDRLRRRLSAQLTPRERLARAEALRQSCFALMMKSHDGWAHFWRRNLRKRAVGVQDGDSIRA